MRIHRLGLAGFLTLGSVVTVAHPVAAYQPAHVQSAAVLFVVPLAKPGTPQQGTARLTLNPALTQVCYRITTAHLAPVLAAHIHRGAAGTTGPIVVPFFGYSPAKTWTVFYGCVAASHAVVLAILNCNEEMPSAFRAGASFVLVKPLSLPVLTRTLRVSYPLMMNEKRRSFRCPLAIPIHVSIGSQPEFMATSVNISEVGIALTNSLGLQVGDRVNLRLTLPLTTAESKISAEVCWCDPAGSSGMEFVQVPRSVKERLVLWLASRLGEYLREETAALRR